AGAGQVPGLDKQAHALQKDKDRLKHDLRHVRENLARRIPAPVPPASPRSAARLSSPKSVALRSGEPAMPTLVADAKPTSVLAGKPAGTQYRVQRGDTLSALAARVYHNPRKWKLIYDANRDTLGSSQKLKIGQVLIIPK
ncbi:MAG: LysM peptidoglycan-binding domain-containing protein, partial [Verrucomicrobia bacterium]|nr:LysM peptidoglycan-binding domain-containing protein [Verrucomicrobiota bacterium]